MNDLEKKNEKRGVVFDMETYEPAVGPFISIKMDPLSLLDSNVKENHPTYYKLLPCVFLGRDYAELSALISSALAQSISTNTPFLISQEKSRNVNSRIPLRDFSHNRESGILAYATQISKPYNDCNHA